MAEADSEVVEVVLEEDSVDVEVALVDELFDEEVVAAPPAVTVVGAGLVLLGGVSMLCHSVCRYRTFYLTTVILLLRRRLLLRPLSSRVPQGGSRRAIFLCHTSSFLIALRLRIVSRRGNVQSDTACRQRKLVSLPSLPGVVGMVGGLGVFGLLLERGGRGR